jgi:DNA-binding transcriptional LysR family regulator
MKDILALKLFTRVARLGSFSATARENGLSQSKASRVIADLETGLGAGCSSVRPERSIYAPGA